MPPHVKPMRALTCDAESNAAAHISKKSWCVPNMRVQGGYLFTERGQELYEFLKFIVTHVHAARILASCFELMKQMHADNAYHLDFHPRNIIICKTIKAGAVTVDLDSNGIWALYAIDFETLYHPDGDSEAFETVTEIWNSTLGATGRMPFEWYKNNSGHCFDVYTFSTYVIKYVYNPYFAPLKPLLYHMCTLDTSIPLPSLSRKHSQPGEHRPYYTYLDRPRTNILTAHDGVVIFNVLSETLNSLASNRKNSEVDKQ